MRYRKAKYEIPFNKPHSTGNEIKFIEESFKLGQTAGNGYFTKKCQDWIQKNIGGKKVLLTTSCTSALEMAAKLINIRPGDEIIMPSFTFVTTASSMVSSGGVPVFVDVRVDTLNIDEGLIEKAITNKTKAIMVVHYAGVSCEMDKIKKIAKHYKLYIIEDAAQAILSRYKDQYISTIGDVSAISFHETKNVISGEGGALIINNAKLLDKAEIIWEKGTNRNKFLRGEVDKYTWVDMGSSYLPSEITASFLFAQLHKAKRITNNRLKLWNYYHYKLKNLEDVGLIRRPIIPKHCYHNGHMYYILLNDQVTRDRLIAHLKSRGILAVFHYIPLHSSPAGKKFCKTKSMMKNTNSVSERILRLPLFVDLKLNQQNKVVKEIQKFLTK